MLFFEFEMDAATFEVLFGTVVEGFALFNMLEFFAAVKLHNPSLQA
jgi:hypothetical protein